MELNQQPANEARDTSEPGGSVRRRPTSGCRPTWGCRGFLLTCGVLYFIMTILATVKWSFWRPTAMDGVALFSNGQSSMRNLAIVVPTHSGDLEDAIGALELWPKVCSATTLHHMHLVVYYSGSAGDGVWNEDAIPNVARTGGRCFERTKAVFASLTKEVTRSTCLFDQCCYSLHVVRTIMLGGSGVLPTYTLLSYGPAAVVSYRAQTTLH